MSLLGLFQTSVIHVYRYLYWLYNIENKVSYVIHPYCRFHDKLQINFLESQQRFIPLSSYGQGTTITSDPPLTQHLELGANFR